MGIIAYADCPSGVSGDMLMAALIDAGTPLDYLIEQLSLLKIHEFEIKSQRVLKHAITARSFEVLVEHQEHHRHWSDIRGIISSSGLNEAVKTMSLDIFKKIAFAEARIHGVEPAHVHFHEVGAIDSIVDIVGFAIGYHYLRIEKFYSSELPLGSGFVQTAHGSLPLPAPAALALLEGVPTYGTDLKCELVTPTGAAILSTVCEGFGLRPPMTITKTGYGAGTRDLPDRPNVLRLTIGEAGFEPGTEELIVAETNIDDMNPEIFPYVMDQLMSNGALDAWMTPIQMKKGRPGMMLSFLARPGEVSLLKSILLSESSTLGVRTHAVMRESLDREARTIKTPWGDAAFKEIKRSGRSELTPEFEACKEIAEKTGIPLIDIYKEMIKIVQTD